MSLTGDIVPTPTLPDVLLIVILPNTFNLGFVPSIKVGPFRLRSCPLGDGPRMRGVLTDVI